MEEDQKLGRREVLGALERMGIKKSLERKNRATLIFFSFFLFFSFLS